MSSRGGEEGAERTAYQALETAVGRALGEIERLRAAVGSSEARRAELRELLKGLNEGGRDPAEMSERLDRLETENVDLRRRLDEGRVAVERLLARIRFLEDQR